MEYRVRNGKLQVKQAGKWVNAPDNLTVGGSLDLRGTGITRLPDNLTVGGSLDLEGTGITQPEQMHMPDYPLSWRNGKYILADGIFSEVVHRRGSVFKVKKIAKEKARYLVTDGDGKWAHGETLKTAREDLVYKISNRDKSAYEGLGPDHVFTFREAVEAYRVITGACTTGVKCFMEGRKRKAKYSVREIVEITRGQYGNDAFAQFFGSKGE